MLQQVSMNLQLLTQQVAKLEALPDAVERLSDLIDGNRHKGVEGIRETLEALTDQITALHKEVAPVPQLNQDVIDLKKRMAAIEDRAKTIRNWLIGFGAALALFALATGNQLLAGIARLLGAP